MGATNDGTSPLFLACQNGHTLAAVYLLQHGADPGQLNKDEADPMIAACCNGHLDCVQVLVEHEADIRATWKGVTPLALAEHEGFVELAGALRRMLEKLPSKTEADQLTPRHQTIADEGIVACQRRHSQDVRILVPEVVEASSVIALELLGARYKLAQKSAVPPEQALPPREPGASSSRAPRTSSWNAVNATEEDLENQKRSSEAHIMKLAALSRTQFFDDDHILDDDVDLQLLEHAAPLQPRPALVSEQDASPRTPRRDRHVTISSENEVQVRQFEVTKEDSNDEGSSRSSNSSDSGDETTDDIKMLLVQRGSLRS